MKLIKRLIVIILLIAAFAAGATYYGALQMYKGAIAETPIEDKVAQIQAMDHYTPYSQLPETYIDGIIAVEDKRFEYHKGYDLLSVGRAFVSNIKAGELVEGGSTITQQVARTMYFDQDKKMSRKMAEILVARDIEKLYEKDEILELYVNMIYFGSGYYGIYDASQGYFGKLPYQLNSYESTMLAGIPNAPSAYSPDANPVLAEERRQQVIEAMVKEGYIEAGEIQ